MIERKRKGMFFTSRETEKNKNKTLLDLNMNH